MATAAAGAGLSDEFVAHNAYHWHRLPNSLPPAKRQQRIDDAAKLGIEPDLRPAMLTYYSGRTYGYQELATALGLTPEFENINPYEGAREYDAQSAQNDPILQWVMAQGWIKGSRAKRLAFTVKDADDIMATLEDAHVTQDMMMALPEPMRALASDLKRAASALEGVPVEGDGPLLDMALQVKAQVDLLADQTPDFEPMDLSSLIRDLRKAADDMNASAAIVEERIGKIDTELRKGTGVAIARDDSDPNDILCSYEAPEHWRLEEADDPDTRKAMRFALMAGEITQDDYLKESRSSQIRRAAKMAIVTEKSAAQAERNRKAAQRRKDLQARVREVWSNV